jgi:hypothetical protein
MQPRTEDLLTLRDGEPIDAALKARLRADPETARLLQHLAARRDALRALPPVLPGADVDARVLAAMRTAAGARNGRRPGRIVAAVAGLAAAVLVAIALRPSPVSGPELAVGAQGADRAAPARAESPAADDFQTEASAPDYLALIEESARLERALSQLPAQRRVMTVGTAGTIAGLEDQIALIDAQLTVAAGSGAQPEFRAALWRERVDVMSALVQVRYAQSKMFLF